MSWWGGGLASYSARRLRREAAVRPELRPAALLRLLGRGGSSPSSPCGARPPACRHPALLRQQLQIEAGLWPDPPPPPGQIRFNFHLGRLLREREVVVMRWVCWCCLIPNWSLKFIVRCICADVLCAWPGVSLERM